MNLFEGSPQTTTHNTQQQQQPPKPQPQPRTTEPPHKHFVHEENNSPTDRLSKACALWLSGQVRLLHSRERVRERKRKEEESFEREERKEERREETEIEMRRGGEPREGTERETCQERETDM